MSNKVEATFHGMRRGAEIVGEYRYSLSRQWDAGAEYRVYVMLNPSTADAYADDPTIRRCISFAQRDGFGGIMVLNLFAYRATDPRELRSATDPVGPENDDRLRRVFELQVSHGLPVVAAWGAGAPGGRVAAVKALVPELRWQHLGLTKDGHPKHPLYLAGVTAVAEWSTESGKTDSQVPDGAPSGKVTL